MKGVFCFTFSRKKEDFILDCCNSTKASLPNYNDVNDRFLSTFFIQQRSNLPAQVFKRNPSSVLANVLLLLTLKTQRSFTMETYLYNVYTKPSPVKRTPSTNGGSQPKNNDSQFKKTSLSIKGTKAHKAERSKCRSTNKPH